MFVITVSRKPLAEASVVSNVLAHGAGALHIDAARIHTTDSLNGGAYSKDASDRHDGAENWRYKRGELGGLAGMEFKPPSGRWPANLVLGHKEGCLQEGTKQVKAITGGSTSGSNAFGQDLGWNRHENRSTTIRRQGGGDGLESVALWNCAEGCPVADLDTDAGGASRFFKQIKGE